jgi:ribosomal protein S18 acetylase RimI-like enzyme
MEIKEATITDLKELSAMNIQLRYDEKMDNIMTDKDVEKRMREFLEGNIYKAYLLINNNITVGYGLVDTTKKPIYLRQIYVKPEFRKNEFGSLFISDILGIFNTNEIDVEVMTWNNSAIKYYENFGFKKRYFGMRFNKSN